MAEVVVDMLNAALGTQENFGLDAPKGKRMIEVGSSRLQNGNLDYTLRIFGRPARTTACDCERTTEPALPQTLYRMTDPAPLAKLKVSTGRVQRLARDSKLSDDQALDELFLATLSRLPTDPERSAFAETSAWLRIARRHSSTPCGRSSTPASSS